MQAFDLAGWALSVPIFAGDNLLLRLVGFAVGVQALVRGSPVYRSLADSVWALVLP